CLDGRQEGQERYSSITHSHQYSMNLEANKLKSMRPEYADIAAIAGCTFGEALFKGPNHTFDIACHSQQV
ncbi:hypothetical protein Ciccas_011560, partial [Cichlidogyrus casuarinus]